MDEAERCHEIAYIAFGDLLAQGTVDDVISQSRLVTYTVTGQRLPELFTALNGRPGIDMVAPFGASLHVSGRDARAFEAAIAPWRSYPLWIWTPSRASLEDVFIELSGRSWDSMKPRDADIRPRAPTRPAGVRPGVVTSGDRGRLLRFAGRQPG
jgi:ABC-2 type transport system ATP-binding protein